MSEFIKNTSDANFESEVLQSDKLTLVDFWAEWCGPCKAIAPILDEVAKEFNQTVQFFKLNVDDNPDTPAKYGVRGIPSLMLFKDGNVTATKVGALTKSQLVEFLNENLK